MEVIYFLLEVLIVILLIGRFCKDFFAIGDWRKALQGTAVGVLLLMGMQIKIVLSETIKKGKRTAIYSPSSLFWCDFILLSAFALFFQQFACVFHAADFTEHALQFFLFNLA